MKHSKISVVSIAMMSLLLGACGGGGGGESDTSTPPPPPPPPPPMQFSIGGDVSGLAGSGLILQNNASDDLSIQADGSFVFATEIDSGSNYAVTVSAQPTSPAQTCTVSNGSGTATADVSNVAVNCVTDASSVDTDGDGLTDSQEAILGTSPQLADTDGDGLSDGRENTGGFFNPLIADLPRVRISVIGSPSIDINIIDTSDAGYSNTYTSSYEQGQQNAFSRSDTESTSATVSASVRVYNEAEASASPAGIGGSAKSGVEASVSASVTQEYSTSTTSMSATNSRQEHGELAAETSNTNRITNGGVLRTTLEIENTSDLSFELEGVEVLARRRSGTSGSIETIGTLTFDVDGGPRVLATGESVLKAVSQDFNNANTLEALMADPSGLLFTIGAFDMNRIGNEEGRDWARISQDVNELTAQVVIDYGDNQGSNPQSVERYQVATNVARDPVTNRVLGISMQDVLNDILEIPYTTISQEVVDENGQGTGVVRTIVNSIRDVNTTGLDTGFWYVFTSSDSADDASTDFEDLILMPGDLISMVYLRDQDGDRIFDREEFLLGTNPLEADTDGDGLTDYEEAREGWGVSVEGQVQQVYSDPLNPDSDGDNLNDFAERELPRTNPDRADTDGDGVNDDLDMNPTGPDRVTFDAKFNGPTSLMDTSVNVISSASNISRVVIDWGDGSSIFQSPACTSNCSSSLEVNTFHNYQTTGTYSVQVTAELEGLPSESRTYTVNLEPRFSADVGLSFMNDWNENDDTRLIADINADGLDDIVGFGPDGTYTSLSNGTGFEPAIKQFDDFASGASYDKNVKRRLLANIAGNAAPDIVVFDDAGVYLAENDGTGNFTVLCNGGPCFNNFGTDQGYLNFADYPRYLADMNNDGLDDVVAFANDGVVIATATGSGFVNANPGGFAVDYFGNSTAAGGWVADTPRILADLNGDGYDDIVAYGNNTLIASLNLQDNTFQPLSAAQRLNAYMTADTGYRIDRHLRISADINNDNNDDLVAFANDIVIVGLANDTGSGEISSSTNTISTEFAYNDAWRLPNDQRYLYDVNGDGYLDIVGFSTSSGVSYALSNGAAGGSFVGAQTWINDFTTGWTFDKNPRYMGDVNGDGRGDIIAFDDGTVEVLFALSAE